MPPDAMRKFLEDSKEQRRRVAEAEAREAAAALAREVAAIALIGGSTGRGNAGREVTGGEVTGIGVGGGSWGIGGDSASDKRRGDLAAGIAAGGTRKLIDRVFDHLARPTISAPWEELAHAASELALEDLARSLDQLSKARGTSSEPAWRIAVALVAEGARRSDGELVCEGLSAGRQALATKPRVRVRGVAATLAISEAGWILIDGGGASTFLGPSPMNATLAAELAEGDPVDFEAVLARDEVLGAIAVLAGIGQG